jgi:hypothetical protein
MKKPIIIAILSIGFVMLIFKGIEHTNEIMNNCLEEHSYLYCKGLYE